MSILAFVLAVLAAVLPAHAAAGPRLHVGALAATATPEMVSESAWLDFEGLQTRSRSATPWRSTAGYSDVEMRIQERHHVIRIRVTPEHRFREDEVAGDVNVEDAICARYHFNRGDGRFELLENPRCQTDSVWPRASGHAVLDANRGRIRHATSLSAR